MRSFPVLKLLHRLEFWCQDPMIVYLTDHFLILLSLKDQFTDPLVLDPDLLVSIADSRIHLYVQANFINRKWDIL